MEMMTFQMLVQEKCYAIILVSQWQEEGASKMLQEHMAYGNSGKTSVGIPDTPVFQLINCFSFCINMIYILNQSFL